MRSLWTGSISFGLVYIPVKMYSATQSHTLDLDMLHKTDHSRVRYVKTCEAEGKPLKQEDIVKGYEYSEGEYVILTDKDLKSAALSRSDSIDIVAFTDEKDIDTIYYDKPYYLEPGKGAAKVYTLLREALNKSGKVGIAKFVFKQREHLAVIKPSGNMLVLNQLRFGDEIRKTEGLDIPAKAELGKKELDMALQLVDGMTHGFDPDEYHDTYKEALEKLIEQKAEGRTITPAAPAKAGGNVLDLMSALKASLKDAEKSTRSPRKTSTGAKAAASKPKKPSPTKKRKGA